MWGNQLNGFLPRQIGNLTMLKKVDLGVNALSGEIPKELGNLEELEELKLDMNGLRGSIPWEIFNVSSLTILSLTSNYNLSGTLPSSLGYWLPSLEELYLGMNNIRGVIPAQISNASNLVVLELCQNQFTGFIPNSLGNLPQLQLLSMYSNNLTTDAQFSLITSLTNCRYLQQLSLSFNPLNTLLPNSIGNLSTTLEVFFIRDCTIQGPIPNEIGNLSNLKMVRRKELAQKRKHDCPSSSKRPRVDDSSDDEENS
nr:probable LRR receptor-like serine/threonine-protein kinase At3g47570 [Ipomoea batatas]